MTAKLSTALISALLAVLSFPALANGKVHPNSIGLPSLPTATSNAGDSCTWVPHQGAVTYGPTGAIHTCQSGVWTALGLSTVTATCSGGVGYDMSACTAHCPAGTTLISGGCGSDNERAWKVGASRPVGNGWHCNTSEDYAARQYYRTTTGYALCAR